MIKDNLPGFVYKALKETINAEQPEVTRLEAKAETMTMGFYVKTANNYTIEHWEELLGLDHPAGWGLERRRERAFSRLLSAAPITKAALKEIIESAGGVAVEITENPNNPSINIKFVGEYGVPRYLSDIKAAVELMRPFHLGVTYEYLYACLDAYGSRILADLAGKTLLELAADALAV